VETQDHTMAVLERAHSDGVQFVSLQFSDIFGTLKSVTIPVTHLQDSLTIGTWFDGSSVQGFARICESDMLLRPDPDTYSIVPWRPQQPGEARMICDVYRPDGQPFEGDPRYILKRALQRAREMGLVYNVGPELEFFLLERNGGQAVPTPHDPAGYFDLGPRDRALNVRREIACALEGMGIEVETAQHECAPGQHEIDIRYREALTMADQAHTLKYAVKSLADQCGLHATFMPKPFFGVNGSGMHVHQSLFDLAGRNVFFDPEAPYHLSSLARSFVAGQLQHAQAMSAVLSPTVNSYKRLTPGYEAPVYICWGQINRSALIRIPSYVPGREQSARAELRCPDPSCNPYLAFAVMLQAGLDGIARGLEPPEPVDEDVYHFDDARLAERAIAVLPGSLGEALSEMADSALMREALGEHTFSYYLWAKKKEWDAFRIAVTDWEIERYMDVL
jgi:glutamine synthetase